MTRKVIIPFFICLILSANLCHSQDSNLAFQERTNSETERRLLRLEGGIISLTTGVSGILPLANGGTGSSLTDPGADRIYFWDDSETKTGWLTVGTGLAITATTLTAKPMRLVSTTTVTAANTGDIAIEPDKQYFVTMDIEAASGNPASLSLRFNSSATAGGYSWYGTSSTFETAPTTVEEGDDSDAQIILCFPTGDGSYADQINETAGFLKGSFYLDTNKISSFSAFVMGEFISQYNSALFARSKFEGFSGENLTISSFELLTNAPDLAFVIRVYELEQ